MKANNQVSLFYSYAHADIALRDELDKHLSLLRRSGLIAQWYDRDISAGTEWADQIDQHLNTAHIVLLLISADFLASDYCYSIEMNRALERHDIGEARVIPILLRHVDWESAPFARLQVLPQNASPIITWIDQDLAFKEIAIQIRKVVKELQSSAANISLRQASNGITSATDKKEPTTSPGTSTISSGQGPQPIPFKPRSLVFIAIALIVLTVPLFFWLTKPPPPAQGFLSSQIEPAASFSTLNLTELGSENWTHWGRGCHFRYNPYTTAGVLGTVDYKRNGFQIQVEMGKSDTYGCYYQGPSPVSWTDGTPQSSNNSDSNYIWNRQVNEGFTFVIPASTSQQTFSLYCGGYGASGQLTARLSDNSAPARVYMRAFGSPSPSSSQKGNFFIYTFTYKAASADQYLKITYVKTSGTSDGSIDLVAAWLAS